MSKQLLERLRKSREIRIEVGHRTFIAMRPTDLEMVGLHRLVGEAQVRRALDFVVGWSGVTEDDIVGGATMDPVKFDPELWAVYSADHSEIWNPIADKIFEAYNAKIGAEADAAKN